MLPAWKFRRSDDRPGENSGKAWMKLRSGIVIVTCVVLLLSACSEEKKREAARLAAQVNGDSSAVADQMDSTEQAVNDSMLADSMHETSVLAEDSSRKAVDSPVMSGGLASAPVETSAVGSAAPQSDLPKDSVIPDINAVPAENGTTTTRSMPRYIEDAYTVQVASSTDRAFSQEIVDTFLARGYEAYLGTVTRDDVTYYRVRVGHYSTSSEANQTAVEINRKYSLQSWVDKITK
jgi:cell division septation protein DedD